MNIHAVQFDIQWEEPEVNRMKIRSMLNDISDSDLIVLPEMFTTGFSMRPEVVAESYTPEMPTLLWMLEISKEKNAAIIGSVSTKDGDEYYNRCLIAFPNGEHLYYDKINLFSIGKESEHYKAGDKELVFEWRGWKIKPQICFDLRFPENARNSILEGEVSYDVLLYVANWPSVRAFPWSTLLKARAIENQAYTIGVNRVGSDREGIEHSGDSVILNFKGEALRELPSHQEGILHCFLNPEELHEFRKKFPVLR